MTRSCWAPALTAWARWSLSLRFHCNIIWVRQWKLAHSSGDKKARIFICTPTAIDTMDKSKQRRSRCSLTLTTAIPYPYAWIVILSPRTSESPLFLPDSNPESRPNDPVNEQPDGSSLFSFQIIVKIHQACLLGPVHSPYLDIKTAPKDVPTNGASLRTFCPVGKHPKTGKHIFWVMNAHIRQIYQKVSPKNMMSLTPLKAALDPKHASAAFTKLASGPPVFLRPPHLLPRLNWANFFRLRHQTYLPNSSKPSRGVIMSSCAWFSISNSHQELPGKTITVACCA